jgi:hypothetical protein
MPPKIAKLVEITPKKNSKILRIFCKKTQKMA